MTDQVRPSEQCARPTEKREPLRRIARHLKVSKGDGRPHQAADAAPATVLPLGETHLEVQLRASIYRAKRKKR